MEDVATSEKSPTLPTWDKSAYSGTNMGTKPNTSLLASIRSAEGQIGRLLQIWNDKSNEDWSPESYALLAQELVDLSPLKALEVASEGVKKYTGDPHIRFALGLANVRSQAIETGCRILQELYDQNHRNNEIVGTLAGTYKKIAMASTDPDRRRRGLQNALQYYQQAYETKREYWIGINCATICSLLNQGDRARQVIEEFLPQCYQSTETAESSQRYWAAATIGEAGVNQNDLQQAEHWFAIARQQVGNQFARLAVTRHQVRILLSHLGHDDALVDRWLPIPPVVVFAGHTIDRPDSTPRRFPPEAEPQVRSQLNRWIAQHDLLCGFSSAACGSDILFQESVRQTGRETCVVLPYPEDLFVDHSVAIGDDESWPSRFRQVIDAAPRVVRASRTQLATAAGAFDYSNQMLLGLAKARALEMNTKLVALVVWDRQTGGGDDTIGNMVQRCMDMDVPVHCIDIAGMSDDHNAEAPVVQLAQHKNALAVDQEGLKNTESDDSLRSQPAAILFADVVGYSKLHDDETPRFVNQVLAEVAKLSPQAPVKETWGDGLFFSFDSVKEAGIFALKLQRTVEDSRPAFSVPLQLRVGLHYGPVYLMRDPITELPKRTGSHVVHAARLEPKTPEGQVYASEAFAAQAALEDIEEFSCMFVEQLDLDKRYGTYPTYLVQSQSN